MALFESYERRIDNINAVLAEYGISSVEECKEITLAKGVDCDKIVRETQPICFENAVWAYMMGTAIAAKRQAHLGLSIVTDRVSPKARRALLIFGYGLATVFSAAVLVYGILMVRSEYILGQVTAAMQWPEWIYGCFVPFGAIFMTIRFAQITLKEIRTPADQVMTEEEVQIWEDSYEENVEGYLRKDMSDEELSSLDETLLVPILMNYQMSAMEENAFRELIAAQTGADAQMLGAMSIEEIGATLGMTLETFEQEKENEDGEILEVTTQNVGFRRFEMITILFIYGYFSCNIAVHTIAMNNSVCTFLTITTLRWLLFNLTSIYNTN